MIRHITLHVHVQTYYTMFPFFLKVDPQQFTFGELVCLLHGN